MEGKTAAGGTQLPEVLLPLGDEGVELVEDEVEAGRDFLGGAVGEEPLEGGLDGGDWAVVGVAVGVAVVGFNGHSVDAFGSSDFSSPSENPGYSDKNKEKPTLPIFIKTFGPSAEPPPPASLLQQNPTSAT